MLCSLLAAAAGAEVCTVPGSHATLQEAVDDPTCTSVEPASQTHAESIVIRRSLTVAGAAAAEPVIAGLVRLDAAGIQVELADLRIENGCSGRAFEVQRGAELQGRNLTVVRDAALPCPALELFADGFESGDTSGWSAAVP
jgi:hypothetical protein